jgi:DNA-binding transcriptional LysR family regulator
MHDAHRTQIHRGRGAREALWQGGRSLFCVAAHLSVAIKKLEEELEVKIFERNASEIAVTPLGEEIVRQAQTVLEQAAASRRLPSAAKTRSLARCAWG